jgi:hypothetical protein
MNSKSNEISEHEGRHFQNICILCGYTFPQLEHNIQSCVCDITATSGRVLQKLIVVQLV